MDVTAANLLATLRRTSAPPEQKLTLLSNLKSDIKHYRVPENAQATIFECLKLAITQQTSINIVTAALSTLGHLVKRLKIQDSEGRAISALAPRLWPALQDRLGDSRDSHRAGALQAFIDLHPFCTQDVERIIRDEAIITGTVRTKEMGMQWIVAMHVEHGLPFKSFVPAMVACLEDADGQVRDAAKAALIELFRTASTAAKNDLKKQLKLHNVRQSITAQILAQIGAPERSAPPAEVDFAASTRSLPAFDHVAQFAASINSDEAKPPPVEDVPMDPIFVHSRGELEDTFRDMAPHFEGKESEENWVLRDKDVTKLRRITKGNAPSEYHSAYMSGLKQLQEGILKGANSLRTTMASNGCQLVQELARNLGPAMDSMVESYLQHFVKMCAATKHIAAQNGNQTVDTIFQYVTYNVRLSQHIWLAAQDKNKSPRVFAAGWLRTILGRQAGSKTHFEHTGGLELAEKTIKKGLTDADPKVKESMRATYWAFAKLWPDKGATIMNTLDEKAKMALEKDSHNPNAAHRSLSASTTSRTSGARSALRDRIAAAKREKAQPARPTTAMASISPTKSKSVANLKSKAMGPPSSTRTVSNASAASTATVDSLASSAPTPSARPNSLMSGAARRPVKRPEIARPATADPYAARRLARPETPSDRSPSRQSATSRTPAPQSTIARNRVGRAGSPASPLRQPNATRLALDSRPSSRDTGDTTELSGHLNADDMTMVLPSAITKETLSSAARKRPAHEKSRSIDANAHGLGSDHDFTLVLPTDHSISQSQARSISTLRSPLRASDLSTSPSNRNARSSMRLGSPAAQMKSPSPEVLASPRETPGHRRESPQSESVVRPVIRQGSPLKTHASTVSEDGEVKIYEDPHTAPLPQQPNGRASGILAELPVNENSPPSTGDPAAPTEPNFHQPSLPPKAIQETPLSPPQSPQSKAEKLRSRKLLQSGIARIRARTLDTHGYRKVLELTRTTPAEDLFGHVLEEDGAAPGLYESLVSSILDFVSTPPGSTPTPDRPNATKGSSMEVKRQVFTLLRALLRRDDAPIATWNAASRTWPRALEATFHSRRFIDGASLVVKDIEALVADATTRLPPLETIDLATAFLMEQVAAGQRSGAYNWPSDLQDEEGEGTNGFHEVTGLDRERKPAAQASALALRTLVAALAALSREGPQLDSQRRAELAGLLALLLRAQDAETRKAATECATELYVAWPSSGANGTAVNGDANGSHTGHHNTTNKTNGVTGLVSRTVREKEGFWAALEGRNTHNGTSNGGDSEGGLPEGTKNLIVYFIARRESGG